MAKDDYYTIVAKILVYLYKKYKQKDIDHEIAEGRKSYPLKTNDPYLNHNHLSF